MTDDDETKRPAASLGSTSPPIITNQHDYNGDDANDNDAADTVVSPGSNSSDADKTLRSRIGSHLSTLTDAVNDKLIIIRYATFSTVFLLGAYGIVNTPLFYRYKNLNDIPSNMFTKRKWIHGRIVGVVGSESVTGSGGGVTSATSRSSRYWEDAAVSGSTSSVAVNNRDILTEQQHQRQQRPITILFRHSSPIERLLPQSAMDKILQFTTSTSEKSRSTSKLLYSSLNALNAHRNLLPIELAGVVTPPTIAGNPSASSILSATLTKASPPSSSSPEIQVVTSLIEENARVSLQMLALRTNKKDGNDEFTNLHSAICHLSYRKPNQWFSTTNLGLELVQNGQALVNLDGVIPRNETLIDFNPSVKQIQQDVEFISQLEQVEFAAFRSKEGLWSSSQMRELRREYVEEEEYLNSNLWSRIKRGLKNWILGSRKK